MSVPRHTFVLPLGHVRAILGYCHARIKRPQDFGLRATWRPAAMTSSPTSGTSCTRSRHIVERGLHVDHNEPTISDGWPGRLPAIATPPAARHTQADLFEEAA